MCLYTSDQLIDKLKEIDIKLDSAISKSEIDTNQSKHSVSISVRTLREQYEKYQAMLQKCYPSVYREYFGSSVTKFIPRGC